MQINDYLNPWNKSLVIRTKEAKRALIQGKKLVVYYNTRPDTSTFRYRTYNVYQTIKNSKTWHVIYFFQDEIKECKNFIEKASFIVIGRNTEYDKITKEIRNFARKKRKKVTYDIDDYIFNGKNLEFVENSACVDEKDKEYWEKEIYTKANQHIKDSDGVITTNEFLKQRIETVARKPAFVIRNSLNTEQMIISDCLYRIKNDNNKFKIGYFSGSPTHINDFQECAFEVYDFLKRHNNVELIIVGFMKLPDFFIDIDNKVKTLPLTDFINLQRYISDVDVNIAPLVINDFTNSKSELKYFEASIVGTPTIASPNYSFARAIKNGEDGFLCYPGDWAEALEILYNDIERRNKIAEKARKKCIQKYYGDNLVFEIEKTFKSVSEKLSLQNDIIGP